MGGGRGTGGSLQSAVCMLLLSGVQSGANQPGNGLVLFIIGQDRPLRYRHEHRRHEVSPPPPPPPPHLHSQLPLNLIPPYN